MGLADFIAEAERNGIGSAFGGQTKQQKFIQNDLPALLQEIHANTDENQIRPLGSKFLAAAAQAGVPLQGAEKLMEMIIGPALNGIHQEGLNKLSAQYAAQPAQPAQFTAGDKFAAAPLAAPPSGPAPITPSGNFADAKPEKPLDLNFMMKFGQLTGANPEQYNKMLETPAAIAGKEASNRKTLAEINKEQQAQRQREGLSNEPLGQGLPSLRDIGTLAPAGLPQTLPVRPDENKQEYQNQMLGLKQQQVDNNLSMAQMRIGAANDRAGAAESRAGFNHEAELRKEFQSQSKNFQQVRDSYNRLATADTSTPAGSLVALYTFNKLMDPGARVTEQDYKSAATARPFLERLGISPDSVKSLWEGSKMTTSMRRDFLARAKGLYDAEAQQHQKRVGEYSRVAKESGLNPSRVITDMEATGEAPATPAGQGRYSQGVPSGSGSGAATGQGGGQSPTGQGNGAPPVGTVSKGYRFKGGNPADRNSWEKVQ